MSIEQNTILQILKKLVAIPSFVEKNADERQLAEFVYQYLRTLPFLEVSKQPIGTNGRFNVLATSTGKTRLLLGGHLDTVPRQEGWRCDPFVGQIKDNRFSGLGAYDMKGGCAAILDAVSQLHNADGLMLLFYCDEEYNFTGMKEYIAQSSPKNKKLDLAIIAEPSDLKIWNAHRGVVELHLYMFGKTGHAKNPKEGNNAIDALYQVVDLVRKELKKVTPHSMLGLSTINLASLNGGINKGTNQDGKINIGCQGNMIADYAEGVIDIRTNSPAINGKTLTAKMTTLAQTNFGCRAEIKTTLDFGSLFTDPKHLKVVENIIQTITGEKARYADAASKGFGDGQFLQEQYGIPVINLGPIGGNMHQPNEWVDINSLQVLRDIFYKIIQSYCSST